jgi:hypothetical protein
VLTYCGFPSVPLRLTLAALVLSLGSVTPAAADYIRSMNCVGAPGMFSCVNRKGIGGDPHVIRVPEPLSDAEREHAAERERQWVAHCRPVIHQDRYGVPRYSYAAPGCEFGLTGD